MAQARRDRLPRTALIPTAALWPVFLLAAAGLDFTPRAPAAQQPATALEPADFYTVPPCRLIDTRLAPGPLGGPALVAGTTRAFAVFGGCGIPLSATAISVGMAVVSPTAAGHLTLGPAGTPLPGTSTVNYTAGQTRGNNAVVSLGADGAFVVYTHQPHGTTHFVVDVTGYFGTGHCSPEHTPMAPLLTIDTSTRALSWSEVVGATSYDLYVKAVPGDCGLLPIGDVRVTRDDQKVPDVTSPYDVSAFDTCGICYFVDAVAVSGPCESPLQSDLGLPPPLGFALKPCSP
jgi:hypothetical protein